MHDEHDEDDKATVVIDLNKLRKEKEKQEKELASVAESLEFNLSSDDQVEVKPTIPGGAKPVPMPMPNATAQNATPVVMFELGGNHFAQLKDKLPQDFKYHFTSALPELNAWLKKKIPFVLCLPLDVNPKSVNQLCVQLRAKYPQVHVVLVSKALTPDKVAIHQKSPAKAAAYLSYPFAGADLKKILDRLTQAKAA